MAGRRTGTQAALEDHETPGALGQAGDCGSWHEGTGPTRRIRPRCQVPDCAVHAHIGVWWSTSPGRVLRQAILSSGGERLPADLHLVFACVPDSAVIGAPAVAAGVGQRLIVEGIDASEGRRRGAEPVSPQTLMVWLAAGPGRVVRPARQEVRR